MTSARTFVTLVRLQQQSRTIFTYHFGLLSKHKNVEIIRKGNKNTRGEHLKQGSVLDILSENFDAKGQNIEKAVRKQVDELEKINRYHNQNVTRLANKLSYIQDNIGFHTTVNDAKRTKIFANELIDMPLEKVIDLVKSLTAAKVKYSLKMETDLTVLLSHLVFRNSLDANLFSRIIMKLGLFNLKQVHSKLASDPEDFIQGWNDGGTSRIRCGMALAARYKMLKDFGSAQNLICSEFQTVWLKTLVENARILNGSDIKNMINTVDGLIDYGYLVTCVVKTNNAQVIYSFWEAHPNDGLIKEWLEKDIRNESISSLVKLNAYQKFIVDMYTNPAISTRNKWKVKVLNVSKKLRLGISEFPQIQGDRFFAFTELLLNEMEDEMDNDAERREYFGDIRTKYNALKRDLGTRDNGFVHHIGEIAKVNNV